MLSRNSIFSRWLLLLMTVTALPLHASIPRATYLSSQIAKVASEDTSVLPVVEQDDSTDSSLLCAFSPLRETITQSGLLAQSVNHSPNVESASKITQSGNQAITQFSNYLTDHVGTVLRIVKEDGTVVNQYDYDAFGRVRSSYVTVENRYLFQGREWDKNGGFYYFRNRIYLPERGEFASPDMNLGRGILGEIDGMATLTFCGGDPVNMVDPDGLRPKVTTWLRSGGTYWDVNDMPDNVKASIYATDYDKDGVVSTRAATHALIGVLGVFEGAALMGWDIGEGISGSENIGEENMIAGMFNVAIDEGVGTLGKEMVLSPFKAIASGDAEQFGTGMFGLYMVGRQMQASTKGISFKKGTKSVASTPKPVVKSKFSSSGAGLKQPSPGVTVKRSGNYWIKEVDPDANTFLKWYGARSLRYQSEGLMKLGDKAPAHIFKNGKLITRDAGQYTPGSFWKTWFEGSRRLGTPMNDIRPRNIGSNGIIFDPSLDPIARGLYWTAGAGIVGAGGYGVYELLNGEE